MLDAMSPKMAQVQRKNQGPAGTRVVRSGQDVPTTQAGSSEAGKEGADLR